MAQIPVINSVLPPQPTRSAAADKAAVDGLIQRCDDLVTNALPRLGPTIATAVNEALAPFLASFREAQARLSEQDEPSSSRPLITNHSQGRFLLPKGDE